MRWSTPVARAGSSAGCCDWSATLASSRPMLQKTYRDGTRIVARVDAYFPGGLVVEVSGHGTHASRRQLQIDAQRHTELTLRGLRVVTFTYEDVRDRPDWVIAPVAPRPNVGRIAIVGSAMVRCGPFRRPRWTLATGASRRGSRRGRRGPCGRRPASRRCRHQRRRLPGPTQVTWKTSEVPPGTSGGETHETRLSPLNVGERHRVDRRCPVQQDGDTGVLVGVLQGEVGELEGRAGGYVDGDRGGLTGRSRRRQQLAEQRSFIDHRWSNGHDRADGHGVAR